MLHQFYPDYEADSAYGIDYRTLYEQGYRGIIFDIDNTLVPHGAPATPQATEFFGRLRELGFQTLLLSNNKEPRVKSFADAVGASYIYKAGKPGREGYLRAMEQMHTGADTTLLWGISCSPMCGELKMRDHDLSDETHSSERRDSDRTQEISGKDRTVFLP